jgi:hypothetical protein
VLYDLQYPASIIETTRRILNTLWWMTFAMVGSFVQRHFIYYLNVRHIK